MRNTLLATVIALCTAAPAALAAEPTVTVMDPQAEISRVEFAVAVADEFYAKSSLEGCFANLAPSKTVTYTHLFSDVQKDQWYAKKLCVGMMAGVINGNRDGSFRPLAGITAAEASKILAHAYGLTYPSKAPTGQPWYAASMEAMRIAGALPSTVKPGTVLTRGDMERMIAILKKQERFPDERVIGEKSAPLAAATTSGSATRTGERISRRTLLEREHQKAQEKMAESK